MNKVTLVGRLGQDPEHQTSQNGKTYVKFSLATNDGYGENKKTNWHSCTAFGKAADIINQYTQKGSEIAVSGSIDYNKHEDKFYTNILVNDFTFIGGKSSEASQQTAGDTPPTSTNDDDDLPF